MGIHSPRFAINCYKTSPEDNLIGDVIEPWMYPSATPLIRTAIKRRYELIPYTYSLSLLSHRTALPPQRWTGWGYETDKEVFSKALLAGDTQYWFGDALLVAGVFEAGKNSAKVYLPTSESPESGPNTDNKFSNLAATPTTQFGFLNTNAPYQHLSAGKWHEINSTWHSSIPVIARCGSAVPVGKNRHTTSRAETDPEFSDEEKDDERSVEIFPPPRHAMLRSGEEEAPVIPNGPAIIQGYHGNGPSNDMGTNGTKTEGKVVGTFENVWYEDDGISAVAIAEKQLCTVTIVYEVTGGEINVTVNVKKQKDSRWQPLWLSNGLNVILPIGEERKVVSKNASERRRDDKGRTVWNVAVDVEV